MISTALAQVAEQAAEHAVDAGPFYVQAEFWVAMAFFAVVGLSFRRVGGAIVAGLDMRSQKIKARIDEAYRLREESQEMLATYQRKQEAAMHEAEEILAHARAEAQRLSEQAARDLDEQLKRREQQALDRIAQAEAQALREVRGQAVDIAIAATRRVIAESLTKTQANALVDSAIKDLPDQLH